MEGHTFHGLSYNKANIGATKKCLRKKSEPPVGIETPDLPDTGPQHFLSCTYVICISSQLGGWSIRQMIHFLIVLKLRKNDVEA